MRRCWEGPRFVKDYYYYYYYYYFVGEVDPASLILDVQYGFASRRFVDLWWMFMDFHGPSSSSIGF